MQLSIKLTISLKITNIIATFQDGPHLIPKYLLNGMSYFKYFYVISYILNHEENKTNEAI